MRNLARHIIATGLLVAVMLTPSPRALAWGDDGHRIVALIAWAHLNPEAKQQVTMLLKADHDTLTARDFASRATWADRYRDSDRNTTKVRYNGTREWHFVDMEIFGPDLNKACSGRAPLTGPASHGPAKACVVDKILQFSTELAQLFDQDNERILALKFLLHFVGDLHQPLHAADNHDQGGNTVTVIYGPHDITVKLHSYWDTTVVRRLGSNLPAVAAQLSSRFQNRRLEWTQGAPDDWARESFSIAIKDVYNFPGGPEPYVAGQPPPTYFLSADYEQRAEEVVSEQLAKAGMRLAMLINAATR